MGIAILVIFSIGLYQLGKWVWGRFNKKPLAVVATEATQQALPEVSTEQNWVGYEAPTFVRRGMPFPVLTAKVKTKRARKQKVAAPPEEDSFPMGDWTLFAKHDGGENHATH